MLYGGISVSASTNTLRSSALALCYLAAEYCAPVWSRSAHTSRVDVQLNSTMRLIIIIIIIIKEQIKVT